MIKKKVTKKNESNESMEVAESDFSIEKDISIPKIIKKNKYPFLRMEVGDSFAFPVSKIGTVRNAASRYGKELGYKLIIRKVENSDQARCWRRE